MKVENELKTKRDKTNKNSSWFKKSKNILGIFLLVTLIPPVILYKNSGFDKKQQVLNNVSAIDQEIQGFRNILANNKNNFLVSNRLADAYLQMAKSTGEASWYILAEKNARFSLANSPVNNYSALLILSSIALARHDFPEAIILANRVIENPNLRISAYRIIFDANMAEGELNKAALAFEQINKAKTYLSSTSIKINIIEPDWVTLTENGMLLEKTGKVQQAENSFLQAIKSVSDYDNSSKAWVYTQYSSYLVRYGKINSAKTYLNSSLTNLNNYIPALIIKSDIARNENNWKGVKEILSPIRSNFNRPDIFIRQAEAEKNLGNYKIYKELINLSEKLLVQDFSNQSFGHRRDYIKLLLLKEKDDSTRQAVKEIEQELMKRHDIDTLILASEVYAANTNWTKVNEYVTKGLKTGINDAKLLYWAGKNSEKEGNFEQAKLFFNKAIRLNPNFDVNLVKLAKLTTTDIRS